MHIFALKKSLQDLAGSEWPSYQGLPVFYFDSDRLLYFTDLALRLSRFCSQAPDVFVNEIVGTYSKQPGKVWSENSYIYFEMEPNANGVEEINFKELWDSQCNQINLVLAPASSKLSSLARLRLFSCLYVQYRLAKQIDLTVSYYDGFKAFDHSLTEQYLEDVWHKLTFEQLGSFDEREFVVWAKELQSDKTLTCLWLGPRSLSHKSFISFCAKNDPMIDQLWSCCPEQNWLQNHEAVSATDFSKFSISSLAYLAGNVRARDLDPVVPQLGEASNVLWFLETLAERLLLYGDPIELDTCQISDPLLLKLCKLKTAYTLVKHNAIRLGAVRDYLDFCWYFSNFVNRVCNNPSIRSRLDSGSLSAESQKIIAGARPVISDMLGVWQGNEV